MPIALIVGPAVALIGIVSVFFVLRRKSVDKRSMYSARRSQIEHKVRAARQRTLTPHGHAEKPVEMPVAPAAAAAPAATATWAPPQAAPPISYEAPAAEAPAAMPPSPPLDAPATPVASPWDVGPAAPAPAAPPFAAPQPEPEPYQPAPFNPAPEPAYRPAEPAYQAPEAPPAEPAWTPGAAPTEPAVPIEPARPAAAAAAWSIVGATSKEEPARPADTNRRDQKGSRGGSSWTLASGDAPGTEPDEVVKSPSATVAIAQYAILVVGLIMVLIGVVVMVANSHVT